MPNAENAEVHDDHLKQSKLKLKGFRLNPIYREVVTVIVSSFTGPLGDWAADHVDEILKLDFIDSLTTYVRVSFSNEDLAGKNSHSLIKSSKFD